MITNWLTDPNDIKLIISIGSKNPDRLRRSVTLQPVCHILNTPELSAEGLTLCGGVWMRAR